MIPVKEFDRVVGMKKYTEAQIVKEIRRYCGNYDRGGQGKIAKLIGVSQTYMSYLLSGQRKPNKKVLDWLGLEVAYVGKNVENGVAKKE